tara:strand:+ start:962 stop:1930 length:969 start_codon:yes stop_codon:yes gene_type:complete
MAIAEIPVDYLEAEYVRIQSAEDIHWPKLREFYKQAAPMYRGCVGYMSRLNGYQIHLAIPDYPLSIGCIKMEIANRGGREHMIHTDVYTVESPTIRLGAGADRHFTQNRNIKTALKNVGKYIYRRDMRYLADYFKQDVTRGISRRVDEMSREVNETLSSLFPALRASAYSDPTSGAKYDTTFTLLNELVLAGFTSAASGFNEGLHKVLGARTVLKDLKEKSASNRDMFLVVFDDIIADGSRAFIHPITTAIGKQMEVASYAKAHGYSELTGKGVTESEMPEDIAAKVSSLMLVENKAYIDGVGYRANRNLFMVHAESPHLEE